MSLPVSKATANPILVILRSGATEESLLTISASIGEILHFVQNDGECVYVALLLARFSAMLRMTESVFMLHFYGRDSQQCSE